MKSIYWLFTVLLTAVSNLYAGFPGNVVEAISNPASIPGISITGNVGAPSIPGLDVLKQALPGFNLSPKGLVNVAVDTLANGNKQVTEFLKDGGKIITEKLKDGNSKITEIAKSGNTVVTEVLANGNTQVTETIRDQYTRTTEWLKDGTTKITQEWKNGNRMLIETLANGNQLITETFANGNKQLTETLKSGNRLFTEIQAGGNTTVTIFLSAVHSRELEKAYRDFDAFEHQVTADALDVAKAGQRYVERIANSVPLALADARKRLEEGKVLDAAWGLTIAPTQAQEDAAARATQENKYIYMAGAIAASTYGGPAGSAAYASWTTYKATGDAELALKNGLISGLGSTISSSIGKMPNVTVADVALKAAANASLEVGTRVAMGEKIEKVQDVILRQMLMSVAQSQSQSVLKIQSDDPFTVQALKNGASAGAAAFLAKGSDADVRNAIMSGIASSVKSQITQIAGEQAGKLSDIEKSLLAGAITGVGVAAAGGNVSAVMQNMLKECGNLLVQDAIKSNTGGLQEKLNSSADVFSVKAFEKADNEIAALKKSFGSVSTANVEWYEENEHKTESVLDMLMETKMRRMLEELGGEEYLGRQIVIADSSELKTASKDWSVAYDKELVKAGKEVAIALIYKGESSRFKTETEHRMKVYKEERLAPRIDQIAGTHVGPEIEIVKDNHIMNRLGFSKVTEAQTIRERIFGRRDLIILPGKMDQIKVKGP